MWMKRPVQASAAHKAVSAKTPPATYPQSSPKRRIKRALILGLIEHPLTRILALAGRAAARFAARRRQARAAQKV
jgi:hypothetical protein